MLPIKEFLNHNKENALFSSKDKILLAVSGGKDSILMLHLCLRAKLNIGIAHCNFNLRKDEALNDEQFVKNLAEKYKLPFHLASFDTQAYSEKHKLGTQEAARNLRYEWFENIATEFDYDKIAIAQHKTDVLETMLLNLCRGTGLAGLHGILPKRKKIIRPLLFLNHNEIKNILKENNISFVEDSSNKSNYYNRNLIRNEVLPQLEIINKSSIDHFSEAANYVQDIETLLDQYITSIRKVIASQDADFIYFDKSKINDLHPKKTILYLLFKPYGLSKFQIEDLLNLEANTCGQQFYSDDYVLNNDRNHYIIAKKNFIDHEFIMEQFQPSITFNQYKFNVKENLAVEIIKEKGKIGIDASKIKFPIKIRYWKNGDKMKPLGMKNLKNISDIFIDQKIAILAKNQTPILENADGKIIWLAGICINEDFKIDTNTKKMITFELQ